jgi:hypothetical protein
VLSVVRRVRVLAYSIPSTHTGASTTSSSGTAAITGAGAANDCRAAATDCRGGEIACVCAAVIVGIVGIVGICAADIGMCPGPVIVPLTRSSDACGPRCCRSKNSASCASSGRRPS